MPATDYCSLIYTRVWALLDASADFTNSVRKGNERKLNKPVPPKSTLQAADVPEVLVDVDGSDEAVFTGDEHFGEVNGDDLTQEAWLESSTYTLKVTITYDDDRIQPANQLASIIKAALRVAGPTLSLDFVTRWGPMRRRDTIEKSAEEPARSRRRRISRIYIPVMTEVDGNPELPDGFDPAAFAAQFH